MNKLVITQVCDDSQSHQQIVIYLPICFSKRNCVESYQRPFLFGSHRFYPFVEYLRKPQTSLFGQVLFFGRHEHGFRNRTPMAGEFRSDHSRSIRHDRVVVSGNIEPPISTQDRIGGDPGRIVEVKIIDEKDNEVPPGEAGEIIIRGPNVMKGYFSKAEETSKVLHKSSQNLRRETFQNAKIATHFRVAGKGD